jgi:hypothetical protein
MASDEFMKALERSREVELTVSGRKSFTKKAAWTRESGVFHAPLSRANTPAERRPCTSH